MRTVYLGTSEFAVGVLRRLADSPHRPALVVTRPDRPAGRGRKLAAPPVAEAARELGIPLDQPASVNDPAALDTIAQVDPQAVCVCAFGALIKEPLLSRWPMLNVHPSLLPRWRGAAPIERAIIAGDSVTGVSIMRVGEGFDDGPVCAQAPEPIRPDDTSGTLASRLEVLGGELLVRTLENQPPCIDQDEALVTYAAKISSEDRQLDPSRSAAELERVVRALTPHIGAYVALGEGSRLGVSAARVAAGDGPPPGVISFDGPVPVLGCAEGALELVEVQPPGGRSMSGADYLRGHRN
ncbi:MAG: methionyl-tRNA formyltransferase [Solirubrobacterales bacterium]|nr:methionyl-tRNA formyltransferase [Solirubrobacterales bacterium]